MMKRMIRRWKSLTEEEVQNLIDSSTPEKYANGGLAGGEYMLPFAESIIGQSFTLSFEDFPEQEYTFHELHSLTWSDGIHVHTEFYQAHELESGLYFIQHMIQGSRPGTARTIVLDTNTGLVTLCQAHFGNGVEAREVARTFYFGTVAGYESYPEEKHHFTSDLVGKAIYWTYHEGMPALKHIYSSEYYYSYVMRFGDRCWMASNPADFVKINDHVYIFSFLEERQAGTQGFFLINMHTLHDCGSFLGINSDNQFECYTVGAKGKLTTMYTYLEEDAAENTD